MSRRPFVKCGIYARVAFSGGRGVVNVLDAGLMAKTVPLSTLSGRREMYFDTY